MNVSIFDAIAILATFISVRSMLKWRQRRARGFPLPPGPKGLPIIGNTLDIPSRGEWEAALEWGKKYGDIIYVNAFGTGLLFLNSYGAAAELFEKRGSYYSSRPRSTMIDLGGWPEWIMSLMPYGDDLRKSRQYFNKFFQKSVSSDYYEVQTRSIRTLLMRLLQDPANYQQRIRQTTTEAIIKISYGYEIVENDPDVDIIDRALRAIAESMGFFVVNALPALRHVPTWFPGTHFQQVAQNARQLGQAMFSKPYQKAKNKMADGTAFPSVMSKLLEMYPDRNGSDSNEIAIARAVITAYAAGADTTVSTLLTFILAMVLYPDVMRKGQEELGRVVGNKNLPTFEDRPNLPYIEAICTECLRWQPVLPLAIAHEAEKDDIFNGYFIPAGTAVYGNVWAMLRDPKRYPDPDKFLPERWLVESGTEKPLHPNKMAFGFGRRICPGRFFAENALFIGVASILSVFDIQKAVDESGMPITPQVNYLQSFLRHPLPFECSITPRSDAAAALIRQGTSSAGETNGLMIPA